MDRPNFRSGLFFLVGVACLLAFFLPQAKNGAVLGRFNYLQILVLWSILMVSGVTCIPEFAQASRKRKVRFRILAATLGANIALVLCEILAASLPATSSANPFYLYTGKALKESNELPYERPANFSWTGTTQGDLMISPSDKPDPFARTVTFQTDHQGFRNSVSIDRADVVFIGDSFTEAGNTPESLTFTSIVSNSLGWAGRNLGRAGFCPSNELQILRRYALDCEPNLVIWQISENNDLFEELSPVKVKTQASLTYLDAWQKRSPTYRLFCLLRDHPVWWMKGSFVDGKGDTIEIRFRSIPDYHHSPDQHPGWPAIASALSKGKAELDENQARLLVVLVPMKVRVVGHFVTFEEDLKPLNNFEWDIPESLTISHALRKLCGDLNVPFVDATSELKKATSEGTLTYLPFDTHLSDAGHACVAAELVRKIEELAAEDAETVPSNSKVE